jgi:HK97 family phage prohead protease
MTDRRQAPAAGVRQHRAAAEPLELIRAAGAPASTRRISFVASDESVDRYGDIIRAAGWKLDAFRANPQLLFAHQSRQLPVGKVSDIAVEGTRLIAHAEFVPEGMDKTGFADTVWAYVEAGFLKAVSVGFIPTKMPNEIKDTATNAWTGGYEFIEQDLLELSVVPVPANPNALQLARDLGLSVDIVRDLFTGDLPVLADAARAAEAAAIAAATRTRTITLSRLGR